MKNVLGFEFYGNPWEHTTWITEDLRTDILANLKKWIREVEHRKKDIRFEEFRTYVAKLRNSFIYIPAGKGILSPCNQVLGKESKMSSCIKTCPSCWLSATADTY